MILGDDASRLERYFRATRTLGKGGRVETLMEGLMKDVLLLAIEHGMQSATSQQLGELQKAMKDLSTHEAPSKFMKGQKLKTSRLDRPGS